MKPGCRFILLLAIAAAGASCEKRPQAADSGTDDGKLRPEVAVARQNASPTPMPNEAKASPTPTP
jgi:hypothetical protein